MDILLRVFLAVVVILCSLLLSKYIFDYRLDSPALVWLGGLGGGIVGGFLIWGLA